MVCAAVQVFVVLTFAFQTLARGYTDEADRLLNYLVYAPFSDWTILSYLSARNTAFLMHWRNVICAVSSLLSTWYEVILFIWPILTQVQDIKDPNK